MNDANQGVKVRIARRLPQYPRAWWNEHIGEVAIVRSVEIDGNLILDMPGALNSRIPKACVDIIGAPQPSTPSLASKEELEALKWAATWYGVSDGDESTPQREQVAAALRSLYTKLAGEGV